MHLSRLTAIVYIDSDCVCLFVHYGFRDSRVASAHLRQRPKSISSPPAGQSPHYLVRPHTDPVGCMTYDWVHNCLQDGVFAVEVQKLLLACSEFGLTKAQIKADLRDPAWQFPSQTRTKTKQLHRIFDPYRDSSVDPNKIKCSASELL